MSVGPVRNNSPARSSTPATPAQPANQASPAGGNPAAATPARSDQYRPLAAPAGGNPAAPVQPRMQDRSSFSIDLTRGKVSGSTALSDTTTAKGSAQLGPNGASASGSVQTRLPGGVSVGFQASASISTSSNTQSRDGFTTATATGTVSMTAGANASAGNVGVGASGTTGISTTFQVRMSDADYARVASGQAQPPNPFDPASMPVGSSVKLESTNFQGTHFEASYRQIKLENNIRAEQGASVLVEKTGANTVRVTTGPSEAIENSFRVGVQLGPANISIGNTTRLDTATLKTAEFDLSTDAGRSAYNNFLANGSMPTANGNGVSNAATIQKFTGVSTTDLTARLGSLSVGITNSNSADQTITTFADNSKKIETNLDYGSAVPLKIQQQFRPDGTEDLSRQKFTLPLGQMDSASASYMVQAFTGDAARADAVRRDIEAGKPVSLSIDLTRDQALALQQRTRDSYNAIDPNWYPVSVQDYTMDNFMKAQDPLSALTEIGRGWAGGGWLASQMLSMAYGAADGSFQAMPGTLQIS